MPAGAVGSCWATNSWSATAWEALTWADAAALAFILDMNSRLLSYLQSFYSTTNPDLTTLARKYMDNELSGDMNLRWRQLIQDATDAMT